MACGRSGRPYREKLREFIKSCTDEDIAAVVNAPCFEVWLNAHYERVRKYQNQKDAQRHYHQLSGVSEKDEKTIPQDFPFEEYEKACGNAHLTGNYNPMPNELAESPATPMPYLLQAVELIGHNVAKG